MGMEMAISTLVVFNVVTVYYIRQKVYNYMYIVKVLITAPLGTFLHKSTYKFTFLSYIIRRVLNYLFWRCN